MEKISWTRVVFGVGLGLTLLAAALPTLFNLLGL